MKINSMVNRVFWGAATIVLTSILISGAISFAVTKEAITEKTAAILSHVLLSVFVGALCCYHAVKTGKNRMQISLGIGVLYIGMSLLAGLLVAPKSEVKLDIWMVVTVLMPVAAGMISCAKKERRR